ncbi:MAG: sugar ABC transporter permease [Chloroflexi bacterium]|nr:sugar ABC transporter permease [Chloroflexota bacterium]
MAQAEMRTISSPAVRKRRKTLLQVLKDNSGFLFVLPAVIIFLVFGLYTVIYSIVLSFFRWNGFGKFSILPFACDPPACQFAGLDNFAQFLYKEPTLSQFFWQALEHNAIMAVFVTLGTIVVALPLAIALNRAARGQAAYRIIIMLPMVTAGIAIYYVWTFIYQPDGLLNSVLGTLGLNLLQAKQGWLGQADRALFSLIIVMIWGAVPMATILYLAGLQTIDRELYEAAKMDGASAWRLLWNITWPLLFPVTVVIVITSINSVLQGYEMVYLMTYGGPAAHTEVVGLQIFKYGFGDQRQLGMASAMSWVLFALVFVVALLNMRIFRSQTEA